MVAREFRNTLVALLFLGGAILLSSCNGGKSDIADIDTDRLMTQRVDSLVMIISENGKKQSRVQTPLMEVYEYASEPYREFRKGVYLITYDSAGVHESDLIADYAIFYEKEKRWEVKGNVVAKSNAGRRLETQQLYWDQRAQKIYSNVDSKFQDGENTTFVSSFESNEQMSPWSGKRAVGKFELDVAPSDSTQTQNKTE